MLEFKIEKKWLLVAGIILFVVFVVITYYLSANKKDEVKWTAATTNTSTVASFSQSQVADSEQKILVDIKGEVNKPGVYELTGDARMKELVMLAGGLTKNAEERQLNLAEKLTDQQMVYVPNKKGAKEMEVAETKQSGQAQNDLIDINTADSEQLQELSGIGPAKAQAIIEYRDENGPFKSVDELKEVSGFGEKTVEKLRESIKI
ncbi:MAG TPA: ComEA family DNA-binding protein [Tetragenococcus sp.]|nr:ComEA family DNA-binding protein [Tetragenococcus sp.]